jgi:hypothetical protein
MRMPPYNAINPPPPPPYSTETYEKPLTPHTLTLTGFNVRAHPLPPLVGYSKVPCERLQERRGESTKVGAKNLE